MVVGLARCESELAHVRTRNESVVIGDRHDAGWLYQGVSFLLDYNEPGVHDTGRGQRSRAVNLAPVPTTSPPARGRGRKLSPVSPGEILQEEFLRPLGISQYRLAKALTVPPRRINEIVHSKRAVTADTALRLARHFGTSERFWLNLQARYDLEIEKDRLGDRLRREVQVLVPAG
jgi:addiction module HigA family antidote